MFATPRRARFDTIFLDRDGTINEKAPAGEYVVSAGGLRLLPGSAAAIAQLNEAGVRVIVVTNQRGVALGRMTSADLAEIHDELGRQLAEHGAHVDAIYACCHDCDSCDCRKPGTGLLVAAAREHPDMDLSNSLLVGDSESDVLAGRAVKAATVRVALVTATLDSAADLVVPSLQQAVDWALGR